MKKVRTRASRVWSMLLVVAMLLTMLPTVAFAAESPRTIYVNASDQGTAPDGSENNPYTEIAAAVEAADDGDTIKVVAVEGYEYEPFELANLENLTIEGISDTYGNKPVIKTNYAKSPVTVYQGCGAVVPGLGMDGLHLIGLEFKNYGYSDAWYSSSIALNGNTGANVSGAVIDSCDFTVAENALHKPNYAAFLNTDTFTFTNNKVVGYNNGVVCMADGSTLNTVTITKNTFNVTTNALYLYNGKYDSNAPGTIIFTDNTMLSGQIELWDYANSRVGQEDGGSSSIKKVITDVDTSEVPIITTAIDQGDTSFKTEDGNAINNVVFNYEDAKQALANTGNGDSFYIGYSADKGEGNTLYTKTAIDEYEDENGTVYNSWAAKLSSTNRTYDTIEDAVAEANDGDTLTISAGTHTITNAPLTISKRINLVGAGADKTTIVGTVKYQLAAVAEGTNAALSVSDINFTAGEDALQGLVFTGTVNTEQHVDISVSDCSFNDWTYGIALHSHVNGSTLTVSGNEFNTWCGINFNQDTETTEQIANNTLEIGDGNVFNCSYAVEQYDNSNAATTPAEDNYYETAEDYENGTPVEGGVIRVTNAKELQNAISKAGTTAATIELAGNITLSSSITVPEGADITIEGNDYEISFPAGGAFNNHDGLEGLKPGTKLTVNDVAFENTSGTSQGYAVVIGFNSYGTEVALDGCSFTNMYCGVYANPMTAVPSDENTAPKISITGSIFTNTSYGYSVDETTQGAIFDAVNPVFTNNEGDVEESETWTNVVYVETECGTVTYKAENLQNAVDAAKAGGTITFAPGTYSGDITFGGRSLTLEAQYPVYVDGETATENVTSFTGTFNTYGKDQSDFKADQTITIEGIAFSGNGLKVGNANYNSVGNLVVRNCTFECGANNSLAPGDTYAAQNYLIKTNGNNDGSYASVTVENNLFFGKPADGIYPIQLWDVDNVKFTGNVVDFEEFDGDAVNISKMAIDATVDVSDNAIVDAKTGIIVTTWLLDGKEENATATFIGDITVADNTLTNIRGEEIFIGYNPDAKPENGGNAYGLLAGTQTVNGNIDSEGETVEATIVRGPVPSGTESSKIVTATFMSDGQFYATVSGTVTDTGAEITLPAAPDKPGYTFQGWYNESTKAGDAGDKYTIDDNIELTAHWSRNSSGSSSGGGGGSVTTYAITVEDSENGQVEANRTNASRGSSITLTVTPDEGYELSSLTVTDADGNEIEVTENDGTYRFTMPSSKVTVTAEFIESSENPGTPEEPGTTGLPFTDVASTDWYYDAVAYAYENDLMNGISSTQFNPNGTTTRGMIATILYRLEGEPEAPACDFTDVAAGQYYTDAIAWAAENHLVNGYGDGTFGPNDNITREQMSALLYRYAEFKGYDLTARGDLSGYTDASQISDYAVTAMQWATAEGLVNGMGDGTLAPRGNSTRAQIATILMRFLENIA